MHPEQLNSFLSEKETHAIQTLIQARANALGLSLESFLQRYPLEFETAQNLSQIQIAENDDILFDSASLNYTNSNLDASTKNEISTIEMNVWKIQRDEWHKESHPLTKNDNGTPKVFYHGTNADFEVFDINKSRPGWLSRGIYLTSEEVEALDYGSNLIVAYVNIKNPFIIQGDIVNSDGSIIWAKSTIEQIHERVPSLVGVSWDEVSQHLQKNGYDGIINAQHIVAFASKQIKSIFNSGTFNPENNSILYQAAYHGTPHEVDKFTTAKIGTGEGNQSFGYGLYFADSKEVAEFYRDSITKQTRNNNPLTDMAYASIDDIAHGKITLENEILRLKEQKESLKNNGALDDVLKEFDDTIKSINNYDFKKQGNLYKVELKPEEEEYLLWDSPLSEQSSYVRKKLKEIINSEEYEGLLTILEETLQPFENSLGQSIYSALGSDMSIDSAKQYPEASKLLHEFGIKGIKYLDASSRKTNTLKISPPNITVSGKWMVKGKDYDSKGVHFDTEQEAEAYLRAELQKLNYNYVIFHDDDVEIVEKLNQSGDKSPLPKALIKFSIKPEETFAVIKLFKEADVSSLPHELAHYFRRTLESELLMHAEEIFKVSNHKWTKANEEAFALGFVKYLATCKAPTELLEETFKQYGTWLKELWDTIQDAPESQFPLTSEHIEFYNKMLSPKSINVPKNTPQSIIQEFLIAEEKSVPSCSHNC